MTLLLVLVWAVMAGLWIIPLYRILKQVGLVKELAFLSIIPPLGMVVLWYAAFAKRKA